MRNRYFRPFRYRLTQAPRALRRATLDNIAIVPASMLPLKALWQKVANQLPRGGVLLCHSPKNARQTKLLERVEKVLKQQGYAVMNLPMEQGI
jgi:hypothetical protein